MSVHVDNHVLVGTVDSELYVNANDHTYISCHMTKRGCGTLKFFGRFAPIVIQHPPMLNPRHT